MADPPRPGPAFVAGATGYVGREVVAALRARGADTVAHVRPDSPRLSEWRQRFENLGADVDDTAWTDEAMGERLALLRPSVVFALLGTTRRRGDGYRAIDLGLTLTLHRAAEACGSKPRFVYLSAVGADRPRGAYLQVRADVEAALRAGALPWTSVRPSFITGPDRDEDRPGERLGAAVIDGAVGFAAALGAKGLRDRYKSVTGAQLAAALIDAGFDPAWRDRVVEGPDLRRIVG